MWFDGTSQFGAYEGYTVILYTWHVKTMLTGPSTAQMKEAEGIKQARRRLIGFGRHYIFALWFLSFFFFLLSFLSSPNLSGHRLDVYHTLAPGVALLQI